jgi:molybdopterin-containing oxidoreductase family membrane subunit
MFDPRSLVDMAMEHAVQSRPILSPLRVWLLTLLAVMVGGVIAGVLVLINGLQVTGLSDRVPWGLWITLDLSAIALGAGAFTFSAIVYLFRIERFRPIARTAVFIGFVGYTSAMLALAMDIGRPDRFWHPLVYWNVHSVLWEITWCVVLYSAVLTVEFLPILFETRYFDRWPRFRDFGHRLHRLTPFMAVLGLALSLLHQSSLGATYGVLSGRAIWFKPSLPIMFIVSAIAGGVSLTLLATIVTSKLMDRELINDKLKHDIARIASYALIAYLYLKLWDWAATSYYSQSPGAADALARLKVTTPYEQTFWWLEVVFGGLVPIIILQYRRLRRDDRALIVALALVVISIVINRWNVTLSGLVAPPNWSPGVIGSVVAVKYFPSLIEFAVAAGIVAFGLMVFTLGARYLPLYPDLTARKTD